MMKFPEDMTIKARIEFLERFILVHSYLYYHLSESVISDKTFDKYARFLASKVEKYRNKIMKTQYGYVFYDFDGNTGFDLLGRLSKEDKRYIKYIALHVLELYKRDYK